jgi:hypothetical protein
VALALNSLRRFNKEQTPAFACDAGAGERLRAEAPVRRRDLARKWAIIFRSDGALN